jgi:hypothetical protein
MNIWQTLVVVFIGIPLLFAAWVFVRALSTRMMTGSWPHQSQEAKGIFESLP